MSCDSLEKSYLSHKTPIARVHGMGSRRFKSRMGQRDDAVAVVGGRGRVSVSGWEFSTTIVDSSQESSYNSDCSCRGKISSLPTVIDLPREGWTATGSRPSNWYSNTLVRLRESCSPIKSNSLVKLNWTVEVASGIYVPGKKFLLTEFPTDQFGLITREEL